MFDTMVLAYALLRAPGFWQDSFKAMLLAREIIVPDLFRAELLSVVWQSVRAGQLGVEAGRATLARAEALVTRVVPANLAWERALDLAISRKHSAYDMLFVAVAAQAGTKLLSYDRRLRKLCPEYVTTIEEFIAA